MSIWCSHEGIGTDSAVCFDGTTGKQIPITVERGQVLSYARGFSNHYPDLTGAAETPAMVNTAHIPPWCVPGHGEPEDDREYPVGPWLRLDVHAPQALTFWVKDDAGKPTVEPSSTSVVLDEAAVRALRDDLTEWLERERLHPKESTP